MSGVVGVQKTAVEAALGSFATSRGGSFRPRTCSTDDPNTLVLLEENGKCSLLYPANFLDWDAAAQHLSTLLDSSVFSFHIHDGDLWMFILYDEGEQVAQFNPLPEYWDDRISEEERSSWSGDAERIAALIPGIDPAGIAPYFRHWDLDETDPGKAFPEDEFSFHDCWQVCDFMRKIGLKYPMDETGAVLGQTYEFIVPER